MSVDIDGGTVGMKYVFIHAYEWAVRRGLIPRFELLSHVQAKWLTFENWLILEIKPFFRSKPFSTKSAYCGKMA